MTNTLAASPSTVRPGQDLQITWTVTNHGHDTVYWTVTAGSASPTMWFGDQRQVWWGTYRTDLAAPGVMMDLALEPGKSRAFTSRWAQELCLTDRRGYAKGALPPGSYTLAGLYRVFRSDADGHAGEPEDWTAPAVTFTVVD